MENSIDELRLPKEEYERRFNELNPNWVRDNNYYYKNKERLIAIAVKWAKDNPEKHRIHARPSERRRYARLKSATGDFTSLEWDNLLNLHNNQCAYCKTHSKKLTVDHIIPLSKGGTNYINNVIPACGSCNSSKHNNLWDVQLALNTTSPPSNA